MRKTPRSGSVPIKFSRSNKTEAAIPSTTPPPISPSLEQSAPQTPKSVLPPFIPPKPVKIPSKNQTSPRSSVAPAKKQHLSQPATVVPSQLTQNLSKALEVNEASQSPALSTESPFERIQREDKFFFDCVKSIGTKRAEFIAELDLLHAIFRDKYISYLDHETIQHLKSLLPVLLRPCDILFEEREHLL